MDQTIDKTIYPYHYDALEDIRRGEACYSRTLRRDFERWGLVKLTPRPVITQKGQDFLDQRFAQVRVPNHIVLAINPNRRNLILAIRNKDDIPKSDDRDWLRDHKVIKYDHVSRRWILTTRGKALFSYQWVE